MRAEVGERLRPLLRQLQLSTDGNAHVGNWEWAGPVVLEARAESGFRAWLEGDDGLAVSGHSRPFWTSAAHWVAGRVPSVFQ